MGAVDGDGNSSGLTGATPVAGEPATYRAMGGYGPEQGGRQWRYEETLVNGPYRPLRWTKLGYEGLWSGSGLARIGRIWMQPGAASDVARVFVVPEPGMLSISGAIRKDPSAMNGRSVGVNVLHNDRQIWPGEGWAEVDFTGRDGGRYRARWSVRRARRKPDGRVQDQEMVLHDLDGDAVVAMGRKTEVLAAIEQRLGLDFGQFCRSVLLAQGEFAAFLRASADERARLLENLTGADVYRKLSRAAHERRRAEDKRIDTLRLQFAAQELLDGPARAALEGESKKWAAEHTTCVAGVELAQQYVNWYAAAAKQQQEEAEATVELRQAVTAHDAAADRRARLLRLQAASAVVVHWQDRRSVV